MGVRCRNITQNCENRKQKVYTYSRTICATCNGSPSVKNTVNHAFYLQISVTYVTKHRQNFKRYRQAILKKNTSCLLRVCAKSVFYWFLVVQHSAISGTMDYFISQIKLGLLLRSSYFFLLLLESQFKKLLAFIFYLAIYHNSITKKT